MTDLDVQVYKDLLTAESEKLQKAAGRYSREGSPPSEVAVQISAKNDGILTAIQLLEQVQSRKNGRASFIRKKLMSSGRFNANGDRVSEVSMEIPEWMEGFDPGGILSAEEAV